MVWDWLPANAHLLAEGLWLTLQLLLFSVIFGMILAIPIGLVQVTGPWPLDIIARGYCTLMRGTPLLFQVWLFYYGVGSLFQYVPEIRSSFLWPILREGYYYAILAFSLNFAGYEGEVMRGAFLAVPKGELEAARAFGMSPWKVLSRIWLPRAVRLVLPTLAGETILQLKSTPIASTIAVTDLMGAADTIRQTTYRGEPLLLIAAIYMILTFLITRAFRFVELQVPIRR